MHQKDPQVRRIKLLIKWIFVAKKRGGGNVYVTGRWKLWVVSPPPSSFMDMLNMFKQDMICCSHQSWNCLHMRYFKFIHEKHNLKWPFSQMQTNPLEVEKRFNGLSNTRQVGWLQRRRQSVSAFRRCVGSSEAKLDTNHLEHHPEGWACGWVGRQSR